MAFDRVVAVDENFDLPADVQQRLGDRFTRIHQHLIAGVDLPAFVITDLPNEPGDLVITGKVRGSYAGTNTNLWARINGDVGTNYVTNRIRALGAVVASDGGAAAVLRVCELTADTSLAPMFTEFSLSILDYAAADTYKVSRGDYYLPFGTSTSQAYATMGGRWQSTDPVAEIILFPQFGLIAAGSEITVEIRPRGVGATTPAPSGMAVVNTDGDSITASATGGGSPWPTKLFPELDDVLGRNVAVASTNLVDMIARAPTDTDPSFSSEWLSVNVLFGGTNDLTLVTDPDGTEMFGRFQTYQDARGVVGWTRVATTILPRSGLSASRETARTTFNTLVRDNWQNHAEALWDVAAIPELQDPGSTAYYVDGLHPNDAGRVVLKNSIKPVLATLGVTVL